jgi:hypothetical protein
MTQFPTRQFFPNDIVYYLPPHTQGNITHNDSELGKVTRITNDYVFVKFDSSPNAKACNPNHLIKA